VGLQHGDGQALYRDSLQAATHESVLFGFRKIGHFTGRFRDLPWHNFFVRRVTACRWCCRRSSCCFLPRRQPEPRLGLPKC